MNLPSKIVEILALEIVKAVTIQCSTRKPYLSLNTIRLMSKTELASR